MKKIVVATEKPFSAKAVKIIKQTVPEGFELKLLEKYTDKSQLLDAVADAEALIIRSDKVDTEVISAGKSLKVVVRAGAGYDNVDLDAANQAGVAVMNTPGQNANAVAELVYGMLLYSLRTQFTGTSGFELRNRVIGIHGYGNIGKAIESIAKGFNMKVKKLAKMKRPASSPVIMTDAVKEMYSTCDVISLHLPAAKDTINCINSELFDLLKDDAIIINTARKEIINEEHLMQVMREKQGMRFLSDIRPDNAEAMKKEFGTRVFFTPKKMGAQTEEANINAGVAAVNQIIEFLTTGKSRFIVNDITGK